MSKSAIFLDRDGTINVEKEYLHRIEDWEWIPGAINAIKLINQLGYLAIVVTNQGGIARGFYSEQAVVTLHQHVDQMLAAERARVDAYYYCPHHSEYGEVRNCTCRKPAPGMLLAAQRDFDIDMSTSFLIGDKAIDTTAAENAGVSPILVKTGYGEKERPSTPSSTVFKKDILEAVIYIRDIGVL